MTLLAVEPYWSDSVGSSAARGANPTRVTMKEHRHISHVEFPSFTSKTTFSYINLYDFLVQPSENFLYVLNMLLWCLS